MSNLSHSAQSPVSSDPISKNWLKQRTLISLKLLSKVAITALHATIYLAVIWGMWEALIFLFDIKPYLLPSPEAVIRSLVQLRLYYLVHTWVTTQEAGYGVLLGFAAGFLLGFFLRYGGRISRLIEPFILASQVFPKEALAPLFIVFLGFGLVPKVIISALICFFPVTINTTRGLSAAPTPYLQLMHVSGANFWRTFWHCHLPFATPYIFAALRVAVTLSVVGAVVGEFVGSSVGLGHVIRAANSDIGTERIYAALLLLGFIGAAFYGLTVFVEKVVFRRFSVLGRIN